MSHMDSAPLSYNASSSSLNGIQMKRRGEDLRSRPTSNVPPLPHHSSRPSSLPPRNFDQLPKRIPPHIPPTPTRSVLKHYPESLSPDDQHFYNASRGRTAPPATPMVDGYIPRRRVASPAPVRDAAPPSSFFTKLIERSASKGAETRTGNRSLLHKKSSSGDLSVVHGSAVKLNHLTQSASRIYNSQTQDPSLNLPNPPTHQEMNERTANYDSVPIDNRNIRIRNSRNPFNDSVNECFQDYENQAAQITNNDKHRSLVVRMIDQRGRSLSPVRDQPDAGHHIPTTENPEAKINEILSAKFPQNYQLPEPSKRRQEIDLELRTSDTQHASRKNYLQQTFIDDPDRINFPLSNQENYETLAKTVHTETSPIRETDFRDHQGIELESPTVAKQEAMCREEITEEVTSEFVCLLKRFISANSVGRIVAGTDSKMTSMTKKSLDAWKMYTARQSIEKAFDSQISNASKAVQKSKADLDEEEQKILREWQRGKSVLSRRFNKIEQIKAQGGTKLSSDDISQYPWLSESLINLPDNKLDIKDGRLLSLEEQKAVLQVFDERASHKVREIRAVGRKKMTEKIQTLNALTMQKAVVVGSVILRSALHKFEDKTRLEGLLRWRQSTIEQSASYAAMKKVLKSHQNPEIVNSVFRLLDVDRLNRDRELRNEGIKIGANRVRREYGCFRLVRTIECCMVASKVLSFMRMALNDRNTYPINNGLPSHQAMPDNHSIDYQRIEALHHQLNEVKTNIAADDETMSHTSQNPFVRQAASRQDSTEIMTDENSKTPIPNESLRPTTNDSDSKSLWVTARWQSSTVGKSLAHISKNHSDSSASNPFQQDTSESVSPQKDSDIDLEYPVHWQQKLSETESQFPSNSTDRSVGEQSAMSNMRPPSGHNPFQNLFQQHRVQSAPSRPPTTPQMISNDSTVQRNTEASCPLPQSLVPSDNSAAVYRSPSQTKQWHAPESRPYSECNQSENQNCPPPYPAPPSTITSPNSIRQSRGRHTLSPNKNDAKSPPTRKHSFRRFINKAFEGSKRSSSEIKQPANE